MNDWVEFLEFDPGISSCETPVDGSFLHVSLDFPSQSFVCQKFSTRDMSVQILTAENTEFDLGHVEPAAMFGCKVKFQAV